MTWNYESIDAMVRVDDEPTWVRLSAVEAVYATSRPNGHGTRTGIHLAGGQTVYTDVLAQDVMESLTKAMRPDRR